ncbi:type II secretion system protein [Rugamonas sp. CCM 8940]|uniref:type II secretion system protein n=1 Tax=Rugamonas sp. CCM 8940 TaxID=2765359 RepID=UPI0018F2D58F|nr:hypothetical protein [Rugamonas sp. CCM 8940]MBJ7309903.1 hypothetical protein [Rugamonas sp. CCM 8940]
MSYLKRQCLATCCILAFAIVCGLWLGEHQAGPLPVRDLLVAVAIAAAAAGTLWRVGRAMAVIAALGLVLIFGTAWAIGAREARHAFNACVQDGEQVRVALANYHAMHGRYPATLAELAAPVPGTLRLPPHMLHYLSHSSGYKLSFADWLVQHEANESHPFEASK